MHLMLLLAGLLALLTTAIHLVAGQREIVRPFLATELAAIPRWTLFACWHWVSLDLALAGAALIWLAVTPTGAAAPLAQQLIAGHFAAYGLLFLGLTLSRPGPQRLFQFPQWLLLLPIAALAWPWP